MVTGYFQGSATFGDGLVEVTLSTTYGLDVEMYVAKFNAIGFLEWVARGGGTFTPGSLDDAGYGIAARVDGSAVVTGLFSGTATFGVGADEVTLESAGGTDVFIASYFSDGILAWAVRAGGVRDDSGLGVAVLADGSLRLVGSFEDTATFGEGAGAVTITSAGGSDIFIAKYVR